MENVAERRPLSSASIGWLAGLIEGEGCIGVYKNASSRWPSARISLNMTDFDVVRRLGNAVVPQVAEWVGRQIVNANA